MPLEQLLAMYGIIGSFASPPPASPLAQQELPPSHAPPASASLQSSAVFPQPDPPITLASPSSEPPASASGATSTPLAPYVSNPATEPSEDPTSVPGASPDAAAEQLPVNQPGSGHLQAEGWGGSSDDDADNEGTAGDGGSDAEWTGEGGEGGGDDDEATLEEEERRAAAEGESKVRSAAHPDTTSPLSTFSLAPNPAPT